MEHWSNDAHRVIKLKWSNGEHYDNNEEDMQDVKLQEQRLDTGGRSFYERASSEEGWGNKTTLAPEKETEGSVLPVGGRVEPV